MSKLSLARSATSICAICAVMLCSSAVAFAQEEADSDTDMLSYTSQITTSTWQIVALTAPVSTATLNITLGGVQGAAFGYLRKNEGAVRQSLAVGAGPAAKDLAQWCAITPMGQERFGEILRKHRPSLLPLLEPKKLTPERAWLFFEILQAAVDHEGIRGGRRIM